MQRRRMHCYFKEHFMMTAKERSAVLALFTGFAAQQGIELGCIFRDTVETGAAGLDALRVALRVDDVRLVAVPAFPHLDVLGDHRGVVREFAAAGMTVVAADSCFSHGPTRSIGCDPSSQSRPFPGVPARCAPPQGIAPGLPLNPASGCIANALCPARRSTPRSPCAFLGPPRCPQRRLLGGSESSVPFPERRGGREVPAPGANRTPQF